VGRRSAPIQLVRQTVAQLAAQAHDREDLGFNPSSSRWHNRAIFVTGAPRSGTSWLHQMLLTHPDLATGGELHVLWEGFGAVFANFEDPDPYMNLSTWVTRSQLVGLTREFVDGVFSAAADASRPAAGWMLDKTPNHAQCGRLLAEVYPDATFVQIIRNPRDAISSQRDLWSEWNPRLRVWADAAADWCATVNDCRTHFSGLRYHEVRYESLLAEPVAELSRIFEVAGLRHDPDFVEQAVDFGKAPVNVRPSDPRISAAKWAGDNPLAEREIAAVAGDLMVELGYLDADTRSEILARRARRTHRPDTERVARYVRRAWGANRRGGALRTSQNAAQVREIATRATDLALQGNVAALQPLLRPDVELVHDDRTVRGAAEVAALLCADLHAASVVPFMSDTRAAAVEVVVAGAPRQHHRYYVHRGRISRIVIEGGR
jgi:hypothetical protein